MRLVVAEDADGHRRHRLDVRAGASLTTREKRHRRWYTGGMSAAPTTDEAADELPWREHQLRIQYVVDEEGNRVSVLLPIDDWEVLMDGLEDLYALRSYENAKAEQERDGGEYIPWSVLKAEFEGE